MSEIEQEVFSMPGVRTVAPAAVWRWLGMGWSDFRRALQASLFYGVVLAAMGYLLTAFFTHGAYALGLITGFLLLGPLLAMGLYDVSRQLEIGEAVRLPHTLVAWRANLPAIGMYAVILALLMAVWIRVSVVMVALFFEGGIPSARTFLSDIFHAEQGIAFLLVYTAVGSGFALLVFATSVVSLPMLLARRRMDTISAMIVSFNSVRHNFPTMLLWAAVIVFLIGAGFATSYLGLVIAVPVIGHASWHVYRDVVES
jgi:uncharacterized membrane protein